MIINDHCKATLFSLKLLNLDIDIKWIIERIDNKTNSFIYMI